MERSPCRHFYREGGFPSSTSYSLSTYVGNSLKTGLSWVSDDSCRLRPREWGWEGGCERKRGAEEGHSGSRAIPQAVCTLPDDPGRPHRLRFWLPTAQTAAGGSAAALWPLPGTTPLNQRRTGASRTEACGMLMEPALEKHPGVAQRDRIQNWPDFQKPNTNGRFSSNLMETNYPHTETISASLILKRLPSKPTTNSHQAALASKSEQMLETCRERREPSSAAPRNGNCGQPQWRTSRRLL